MDEGALSGLAAMASIEKLLSGFGVKWRVAGLWLDMFHSSNLDFQGIGSIALIRLGVGKGCRAVLAHTDLIVTMSPLA
jgi:hypothetical protein